MQFPKPTRKKQFHGPEFKNVHVKHAGRSFASKFEAKIFDHLRQLEMAGEIRDLKCQPHVFLTDARIEMIPDFSAVEMKTERVLYFEAKGFETSDWKIKLKLWGVYGPGPLRIFRMARGGYSEVEVLPKSPKV